MPREMLRSAGPTYTASMPGTGEDLIEAGDGLFRLDHRDDGDLVVGVVEVVGAGIQRDAAGTVAARALWRVAACSDGGASLIGRVDHRDDDAHRSSIEDLADNAGLVPGDAHEGHRVGGAEGEEHRKGDLVVDVAVLHVDAGPVEAGVRDDLGGVGAGDGQPGAVRDLAALPLLLHEVGLS